MVLVPEMDTALKQRSAFEKCGSGADLRLGHRRHKEGREAQQPVLPPAGPVSEQHHRAGIERSNGE
jgi:hypothetical protein